MMFIFASAYGIAAKANRTVLVTKNHPLLKFFDLKAVKVNSFCMCRGGAVEVNEKKHSAFELKVFQLTRPVNYFPRMYLQSWKYFNHVADDIRKQFTFKDDIRNKALDILKQATKTNSSVVTVGIHIRRGDISDQKLYVNHGYIVPTPSYFKKAMDIFRKKYKDVMFVVCSNDMRWSKANINGNDVFFAEGKSAEVDMAILANCYHSIMSAGTFSWWAAFLSGGDAVHYKYPARNGSKFRAEFSEDFSDYFLPGWLGIE